jgi:nucleoside-diphosphate-sugar epimerase
LLAGKPIEADPNGYLNLIHVADAAKIVVLADANRDVSNCLLVLDGRPVLRRDYYAELARLVGAAEPQFIPPPATLPPKRGSADKRVNNALLIKELKPEFQFPDYRAGLADAVADWQSQ